VKTVDVSNDALFFATDETFDISSLLRLRFDVRGQDLDAFCMVVRHGICRGVRGVAVRFYACSDQMSSAWRGFILGLQEQETDPTYVVRMTEERLLVFAEMQLHMNLPYRILTAVRRAEGTEVTMRIEHPRTKVSFDLTADVVRAWSEEPAGMEVSIRELSSEDRSAFKSFVKTGRLPELPDWLVPTHAQISLA
jgi:hypothetical protein